MEKESQKGIIIGKRRRLKTNRNRSALELEKLLGNPVFLDLWVKVKKDWRRKENNLRRFGYDQ